MCTGKLSIEDPVVLQLLSEYPELNVIFTAEPTGGVTYVHGTEIIDVSLDFFDAPHAMAASIAHELCKYRHYKDGLLKIEGDTVIWKGVKYIHALYMLDAIGVDKVDCKQAYLIVKKHYALPWVLEALTAMHSHVPYTENIAFKEIINFSIVSVLTRAGYSHAEIREANSNRMAHVDK